MALDEAVTAAGPLSAAQLTAEINEELTELYRRSVARVTGLAGTNDLTGTVTPARPVLLDGMGFMADIANANTGAMTFNGIPLVNHTGAALAEGQVTAGMRITFSYHQASNAFRIITRLAAGKPPVVRIYTAGATWAKPSGLSHAEVTVIGGGGGGEGGSTSSSHAGGDGGAGGTSSFGAHLSATGGAGGAATAGLDGQGSSGDLNYKGNQGALYGAAGEGGAGTSSNLNGSNGGAGGSSRKLIAAAALGATETVTVGAGGTGGNKTASPANNGAAGAGGLVMVTEHFA
jgi:hypothetical protein